MNADSVGISRYFSFDNAQWVRMISSHYWWQDFWLVLLLFVWNIFRINLRLIVFIRKNALDFFERSLRYGNWYQVWGDWLYFEMKSITIGIFTATEYWALLIISTFGQASHTEILILWGLIVCKCSSTLLFLVIALLRKLVMFDVHYLNFLVLLLLTYLFLSYRFIWFKGL